MLKTLNPMTGITDTVTEFMADPVEMHLLHMVTADPARTPTLVLFADPNYFLFAGAPNCTAPCVTQAPAFAWNHGDVNPDITTTWVGLVGPGVKQEGVQDGIWTDHTDLRPTLLMLVGLKDDYLSDGRAITEVLNREYIPKAANSQAFRNLAKAYKQINAPVGPFGLATLAYSTWGLKSSEPNDARYTEVENRSAALGAQRDALAAQMIVLLNGAEFNNQPIPPAASGLLSGAAGLLQQMNAQP